MHFISKKIEGILTKYGYPITFKEPKQFTAIRRKKGEIWFFLVTEKSQFVDVQLIKEVEESLF